MKYLSIFFVGLSAYLNFSYAPKEFLEPVMLLMLTYGSLFMGAMSFMIHLEKVIKKKYEK
jgi:hypothetical protein